MYEVAVGYYTKGIEHLEKNEIDQAVKWFNCAIEIDDRYEGAYLGRGVAFGKGVKYIEAIENFETAIKLNDIHEKDEERYTFAYSYKFLAHFKLGTPDDYDEAMKCADELIELNPNHAVAHYLKGLTHLKLKDYANSFKSLNDFITINKDQEYDLDYTEYALAHYYRGKVRCYMFDDNGNTSDQENMIKSDFDRALEYEHIDEIYKKLVSWWKKFYIGYTKSSPSERERLMIFAELYEENLKNDVFNEIKRKEYSTTKFLEPGNKTGSEPSNHFIFLRKWNSITPMIPTNEDLRTGGGYFLYWNGVGTIIDPGYDFVRNLIRTEEYEFKRIRNVVITHAHDDHSADLEPLFSLLSKEKKKFGSNHRLNLYLNLGTQVKFSNLLSREEKFIEKIVTMNEGDEYTLSENEDVVVKPISVKHGDLMTENSTKGLIFELFKNNKKDPPLYKLGITSDTECFDGLYDKFRGLDVLVVHMGSMAEEEFTTDCFFEYTNKDIIGQHLGIKGVVNVVTRTKPKLSIISEFGEELNSVRTSIANQIDQFIKERILPADLGLKLIFDSGTIKMKCCNCGKLVEMDGVKYTDYKKCNKILYYCENCKRCDVLAKFREELESRSGEVDESFEAPGVGKI